MKISGEKGCGFAYTGHCLTVNLTHKSSSYLNKPRYQSIRIYLYPFSSYKQVVADQATLRSGYKSWRFLKVTQEGPSVAFAVRLLSLISEDFPKPRLLIAPGRFQGL